MEDLNDLKAHVSKLANCLQMRLTYKDSEIIGADINRRIPLAPGLDAPAECYVIGCLLSDSVGVLDHLIGDAYLLVSYFPKTGSLSAHLIDQRLLKDGSFGIKKNFSIRQAYDVLKPAIAKSFLMQNNHWKPLLLS